MSSGPGAVLVSSLKQRWGERGPFGSWLPSWSYPAALRAVRATIVMPALFALTDKGLGNLQMALFAGFGSFATLVLVSLVGTRRDKLIAHVGLAVAGSILIIIGTAVSSSTLLAALVTIPVTFVVFFAGVAGPNAASATFGALLAYVLPAASPGTVSMIPDRLVGWWLASVAGTVAVLTLAPPATGDRVRAAVAGVSRRLAEAIGVMLRGEATGSLLAAGKAAKHELMTAFGAAPLRPTGLAVRDQALADTVEMLEWCSALVADSARERSDLRDAPAVERQLFGSAAAVLRDCSGLFAGGATRPDLERLEQHRRESLAWLKSLPPELDQFEAYARLSFHADMIAMATLTIGTDALLAERLTDPQEIARARARWFGGDQPAVGNRRAALTRYSGTVARHASVRSVWFVNSVRGALALAAAVAIADLSSVQHGFWVVLGTLSVLRTNASATGATALRALLGTVAGFVIGAALILVLGTSGAALWIALPVAVLIASYAPGTAPFAAGQAAFTVTVAILFNLLVPVGWKVGEVRIEDVAIGCAVSVAVGILFWPRGVAPLVAGDLADAYRSGASYLREAVEWVCGPSTTLAPSSGPEAFSAGLRLDEALRAFLTEQGTKHIAADELWRLIGGTLRLRMTAHAVARLPRHWAGTDVAGVAEVRHRSRDLQNWYDALAAQVGGPNGQANVLTPPSFDADGMTSAARSRNAVWLREHLDHLSEHLPDLVAPATHLAEIRRRPWWR